MPPRTALTFAAMWDPEDGMVTFSGAHLLDSEALEKTQLKPARDDSPRDVAFADDQSQVLTIDPFALAVTAPDSSPSSPDSFYSSLEAALPSAGVDSFAFAQHAMMMADEDGPVPTIAADSRSCLRVPPGITTVPDSPAAASSMALASLMNVPFKKTMMQSAIGHLPRIRPGLRVETDEQGSRPGTPNGPERAECESVTDEGFFEDHRLTPGLLAPVEMNLVRPLLIPFLSASQMHSYAPVVRILRHHDFHLAVRRSGHALANRAAALVAQAREPFRRLLHYVLHSMVNAARRRA